jgi:menaquinol-cytochrome c reductase iron-sulfur subunit
MEERYDTLEEAIRKQTAGPASRERRSFLGALLAVGTAGVSALLAIPLVRFSLHPLLANTTETSWSDVGSANEFANLTAPVKKLITIEQRDGWRKIVTEKPVYVVREKDGQLAVLSSICPHLGCSVQWKDAEQKFVCPCHFGVFDATGKLVSGPPPRGMDRLESRIESATLKVRYQYFRQLTPTKEPVG